MAYRHHPGVYDPKYRDNMKRRDLEDLLGEWYGEDFAAAEITARTALPQKLSDVMDSLLADKLNEKALQQLELREKWQTIIGPPLNKFTSFSTVRENIAYVEVSHPAFLVELRRNGMANIWCAKLNELFPQLDIESITFIPAGQSSKE